MCDSVAKPQNLVVKLQSLPVKDLIISILLYFLTPIAIISTIAFSYWIFLYTSAKIIKNRYILKFLIKYKLVIFIKIFNTLIEYSTMDESYKITDEQMTQAINNREYTILN